MTKVIILGEAAPKQPKKPIKFVAYLMENTLNILPNNRIEDEDLPQNLAQITLLPKVNDYHYDFMIGKRHDGTEFYVIGHFNDGVVE